MIQGPLSGAVESDSANSSDVAALSALVATNSTEMAEKAPTTALTATAASITAHTGEIGALQTSLNGLGNSFYAKTIADTLLADKQTTITDGSLSIARTTGLQTAIDGKQPTNAGTTFVPTLTTCRAMQVAQPELN